MLTDRRSRTRFFARAAVSIALLTLLGWRLRGETSGVSLENPEWLLLAAALVPAAVGMRVASFMLLVNREQRVIGFGHAVFLTLVGAGAGLFLPGGAGDLFKAALGARTAKFPEKIVAASIVDKLTSLAAVASMGVVGSLITGETLFALLAAAVLGLSAAPLIVPVIVPWRLVVRVLGGRDVPSDSLQRAVRTPWPVLAPVLAVSFAGWLVTYTVVFSCCRAAGAQVGASYVYAMAPLITLTSLIPISLAGLGLSQVTMSWLLVRAGVPQPIAISAAFFQLAVNLAPGVVGIVLYAFRRDARQR